MSGMANLKINYSQNPDLKDVFAHREVGKSYKDAIDYQLLSKDDDGAEGSINEVCVEEGPTGEPEEISPDSKEPVMVVIVAQKSGKKKMPAEEGEAEPALSYGG